MSRTRRTAFLAALLLTALSGRAQQWVQVRSPDFSVMTDGGEKRGREVALHFEQLRAVFGDLFGRDKLDFPVPLEIVAFGGTKAFREFAPLWEGKPVKSAGFTQRAEDRYYIALDLSYDLEAWNPISHEYAHALLKANHPPTQLWFEEGFAEYFSTVRILEGQAEIGRGLPAHAQRMRPGIMPLPELFAVTADSSLYNHDPIGRALFYAESWLVVHYLFNTGRMKDAAEYFRAIHAGRTIPQAIEQGFGMPPAELQKSVESYARSFGGQPYRRKLPSALARLEFTTRTLDAADAGAALADLHYQLPGYRDRAIAEYKVALRLNPDHLAANRGLAYAYLNDGDFANAAVHLRRAAAHSVADARLHYMAAMVMDHGGQPKDLVSMREELDSAIALDGRYAEAFDLLAYVDALEHKDGQAVEDSRRAVALAPDTERFAANLAHHLMAVQQWDEAEPMLKRLQRSSDAEIARYANRSLELLRQARLKAQPLALRVPETNTDVREVTPAEVGNESAAVPAQKRANREAPVRFVRGTLIEVDCSTAPVVTVLLSAKGKTLRLRTGDMGTVVLIGARAFSCGWKKRRVAANYRELAPRELELISLEFPSQR